MGFRSLEYCSFLFFFNFGLDSTTLTVGGYRNQAAKTDCEKMASKSISATYFSECFNNSRTWAASSSVKTGSSCFEDNRRRTFRGTSGSATVSVVGHSQAPWAKKNRFFRCLLLEYPGRRINLTFWQPWKLKTYSVFGFLNGLYIFRNSQTESSCLSPKTLDQRIIHAKRVRQAFGAN
jgi:hypothetical protein